MGSGVFWRLILRPSARTIPPSLTTGTAELGDDFDVSIQSSYVDHGRFKLVEHLECQYVVGIVCYTRGPDDLHGSKICSRVKRYIIVVELWYVFLCAMQFPKLPGSL